MNSDWDYFRLAKDGDEKAWNTLFNRYYRYLIKITSLITGSIDAAKDLVQDTFVRIMKAKVKHNEGNFKTYISTVAYRLALREKKHLGRQTDINGMEIHDETVSPLESVIKSERDKYIVRIISSLPDNYKDILVLRFYGEHSYDDIAVITQLPLGTVKSRIFYAVKKCRDKLKAEGIIE